MTITHEQVTESAYMTIRKSRCQWCAKGIPFDRASGQFHQSGPLKDWPRCSAPSATQVIEEQAGELEAIRKRAEEAEAKQIALEVAVRNLTETNARLEAKLAGMKQDLVEAKVRGAEYVPVGSGAHSDECTGRVRDAYICGFVRAWRGLDLLTYQNAQSDYAEAERKGRTDGQSAVHAAIQQSLEPA